MPAAHLVALAATLAPHCGTSRTVTAPPVVPYAFASELGSGVYDFGGRSLQVYRLPISWDFRTATPDKAGWRLRVPVTAGFLDFKTQDLLDGRLPSGLDMLSVAPGIEVEFLPRDGWSVRPFVEAGLIFASGSSVDSVNANVGVTVDYAWDSPLGDMRWSSRANYIRVDYTGCQADDDMTRLRTGLDWPAAHSFTIGDRPADIGPFAMLEWYIDRPGNHIATESLSQFVFETGVMMRLRPMPTIFGFTAPRLGISYRVAGDFSGFRFVIGETF
jgi:hypothetical protein